MERAEFYKAVYNIVAEIPKGKVMTYGQIGFMLGSRYYARRVGRALACSSKQLGLPCHRVVNGKGEMAPPHAFGGKDKQRKMLLDEGTTFKANGCVDIKISLWRI
ncbi:MAG: methylated-DNA--[protein]-cysteine S-methyltransferase [Clostridiales bacterium]|nr:methylated-DNA--[protein]-cysteine S-methyltransferase [Clostridiales bacterium]